MSESSKQFFHNGLDRVFVEPKNFTDLCDEPRRQDNIDVVACRTICLTVYQELMIMGQRTGRRMTMRGCAHTMARKGMYNHTLALFDRFDVCRDMNAADLFRHDYRGDAQRVRVCSCLGDRCNFSTRSSSQFLFFIFPFLFSFLIFW
ncbi:unnamed protein product, partial [Mesorhabditis belari]|uniref:Uncharacterized protein n=1 Tax=Mesorhabditis belari TaxID=2138241 RepID=A0AAF3EZB4_9BILA